MFGGIDFGTGINVYSLEEGVLYIDVVNPGNGGILWRGKGTHHVEEHWDPETKTARINELVDKVLAQFPPGTTR